MQLKTSCIQQLQNDKFLVVKEDMCCFVRGFMFGDRPTKTISKFEKNSFFIVFQKGLVDP
jgi:hypothetical protein